MDHRATPASCRSPIHRANEPNEWLKRLTKPASMAFPTPVPDRWKKKSSVMPGYRSLKTRIAPNRSPAPLPHQAESGLRSTSSGTAARQLINRQQGRNTPVAGVLSWSASLAGAQLRYAHGDGPLREHVGTRASWRSPNSRQPPTPRAMTEVS